METLWRRCGRCAARVGGRDLNCNTYRVATRLELRTEYGPEDIVTTQLFRGTDADERVESAADAWRLTLIAKGFREIVRGA